MKQEDTTKNAEVHILIAEDSLTQAEQVRHLLERSGYSVTIAANGRQALEAAHACEPSLILSDVVMPEMDGYELCQHIKTDANLKDVPFVLLTALADPGDIIRGLECGADSFITKPYDEDTLLARIKYSLANRELHAREKTEMGVAVVFAGERYFITSGRLQILNLLLSTYEAAVRKNLDLVRTQEELRAVNEELEQRVEERTADLRAEIAQRMKAEDDLRELQQYTRGIIEASPDALLITSPEGRITDVNKSTESLTGMPREALIQTAFADHFSDPDAAHKGYERVFEEGNVSDYPLDMKHQDGDTTPVLCNGMPYADAKGQVAGAVVAARDITEFRKLETQLHRQRRLEAIGRLAGGVAHDFNNVLQAVFTYTRFLMEATPPEDERYEDMEQIQHAAEKAATLTRQLLAYGRRQVLEPLDLDLNQAIAEMTKMIRRVIGESIQLDVIPGHHLGTVHADPSQMDQVLMNLCLNARDAMPQGGRIVVETENVLIDPAYCENHPWAKEGRYVLLSVSDTGMGIPPEVQQRIFEPFFTTKEIGEGTGLGLATIYGIVKQHMGLIHVYSEVGNGTTFKIYLPAVGRRAATVGKKILRPVIGGAETVLVVEDDEAVRNVAVRILERAGYKTLTAVDGEEAIQVFQANEDCIDLVFLDVVMPKCSGSAVRERIEKIKPDTRVLFSSGYSPGNSHAEFITEMGLQLIQKPYSPDDLLRRVRGVLDQE